MTTQEKLAQKKKAYDDYYAKHKKHRAYQEVKQTFMAMKEAIAQLERQAFEEEQNA